MYIIDYALHALLNRHWETKLSEKGTFLSLSLLVAYTLEPIAHAQHHRYNDKSDSPKNHTNIILVIMKLTF